MRNLSQVALLACVSALTGAALAFDNGQYDNVSPDIRAWFKAVTAPNGVPCCDIAQILGLSPRTVDKHLEQIYAKLGVENRTAAAAIAANANRRNS